MGALPDGPAAVEGKDGLILPDYLRREDIPIDVLIFAQMWQGEPIRFVRHGNGGWEWQYDHRWAAAHRRKLHSFLRFQDGSGAVWDWLSAHKDLVITSNNFLHIWG